MRTSERVGGPATALALSLLVAALVALTWSTSALAAEVTIGADVHQSPATSGTCGYRSPLERPCAFVDTIIPGQATAASCSGTVTRFRLNGLPKPGNRYRLRVLRRNADGSFTGTATSEAVTITVDGVNEYATSLPIEAGELIGIDFEDSVEQFGLRWVEVPGSGAFFINAFPADGASAQPTGPTVISYLYNADVACTPSNEFTVGKLKGKALTVNLASAGSVVVTSASKAKPKLLKSSQVSGGPGRVKVKLELSAAAKKVLGEKGKVRVRAKIAFTPTGGTTATKVRGLTVRAPKH